jgi:ubiquinone/menaquinone biosynthesis C-methylase UbiE
MAYQSYLTAANLSGQLNGIECSFADKIIADIGTGLGILPHLLQEKNPSKIIAVDVDKNSLNAAHSLSGAKNTGYVNGDANKLPLKDCIFDAIFVRYVFQHVNLSPIFISEIKRTTKNGGLLIIIDIEEDMNIFYPDLPESSKKLFKVYSEYQKIKGGDRFISKKIPAFLSSAGFKDIKIKPFTYVFFKNGSENSASEALKNAFLLLQGELELVKQELLEKKMIGPVEFHKGLNDYFKFLNSDCDLLISKSEFLITCRK